MISVFKLQIWLIFHREDLRNLWMETVLVSLENNHKTPARLILIQDFVDNVTVVQWLWCSFILIQDFVDNVTVVQWLWCSYILIQDFVDNVTVVQWLWCSYIPHKGVDFNVYIGSVVWWWLLWDTWLYVDNPGSRWYM